MFLLFLEHIFITVIIASLIGVYLSRGKNELLRVLMVGFKQIPGVNNVLNTVLRKEARNFVKQSTLGGSHGKPIKVTLPENGIAAETLRQQLKELKEVETDHEKGRVFAYAYTLTNDHYQFQTEIFDMFTEKLGHTDDHEKVVREFHLAFLHENALNPMIYPSLRKMETEVVSMTAAMLNGDDDTVGFMTSGGTESLLMAVKTYRDWARKHHPQITHPEIVAPVTQHPAMAKAAHYFGLRMIHVPVGSDFRADVQKMEKAIGPNTVLLACSAPQYCHGVLDGVEELSALALRYGLPLHVDACFGGFLLPWIEKLGYPVSKWDFRCPGVTSISADLHKYGYCVKGASVILYRNAEWRKFQIFSYAEWPGGLYGSPSMAGTRPGANIAAAWAGMRSLGENGYMKKTKDLMGITNLLKEGVRKIKGLTIIGNPVMTCFAVGSDQPDINILDVADVMETKGWKMERQQKPDCFHCSVLPHHKNSASDLLADLAASVEYVRMNKTMKKKGTAGIYSMMATIPDKTIISDFIKEFFSEVYTLK